ncbi:sugar kinase [Rhizobium sp. P32RR-XVIII]|uniref:sugar kinase n=1 Tax=Rhizobium sp. P32RR-XVIII TaxID=2726738 RepID=UPI0014564725|nr:sugar kinase [Rhizobium sp. P32RR-XVIII]NLS08103.1 sugar kinase [Rhizobium sp. P32RR-XVIII]
MQSIITVGEILVEIMAVRAGEGFREPIELIGPFPSGAPAIFIDQVARLGAPAAIVGAIGDDDFGWMTIERLRRDGVDISAVAVHPGATTGSAFVRYRKDGARDFVFNIRDSANRHIRIDAAATAAIAAAGHLHVVGSSLGAGPVAAAVLEAMDEMKRKGGTVSFDPNIRKEMLDAPGLRAAMDRVIAATDLFLPSGAELHLFSDRPDCATAIRDLLDRGVSAIVHKEGAQGARYVDAGTDIIQPAFPVGELDPTGAGDIFGATFVAGWLRGLAPAENLRLACAAGALAVTRKGPMEGGSSHAELVHFLAGLAGR